MISNQRQYNITRSSIGTLEAALSKMDEQNSDLDPRLRAAMRQQLESQIEELRDELAGYEQSHSHRRAGAPPCAPTQCPSA